MYTSEPVRLIKACVVMRTSQLCLEETQMLNQAGELQKQS